MRRLLAVLVCTTVAACSSAGHAPDARLEAGAGDAPARDTGAAGDLRGGSDGLPEAAGRAQDAGDGGEDSGADAGAGDGGVDAGSVSTACAHPTPVSNGATLLHQSLSGAMTRRTCRRVDEAALYYAATVLPNQALVVSTTPNGDASPVQIALRLGCDDDCSTGTFMVNRTTHAETVLIEVVSSAKVGAPAPQQPFDLHVSLPPPPPGIFVTPTTPLVTTEAGGQAMFEVVLASQPTASVSVALTSSRPSEGTPGPTSLAFDASNWFMPQTVTVTGVDDHVSDGAQAYTILTAPATSADPAYAGLDADDLPFTNLDDEPSLVLEGADHLVTSEDGASATFRVRLSTAPTTFVIVPLASSDTGEATVSPSFLTFSTTNWNLPQTVTATGVDDAVVDGPRPFTIGLGPLASGDPRYDGVAPAGVTGHNKDNDLAAVPQTFLAGTTLCQVDSVTIQVPFAIDELGGIYVVASCAGRAVMFTSADGGVSFSGPIPIPGASRFNDLAVAAGRGGTAFVAFLEEGRGVQLARTTDAGKTWSVRPLAGPSLFELRLSAARDTVVLTGVPLSQQGVPDIVHVLRSRDGGLSFAEQPTLATPSPLRAMFLGPDGDSMWIVDQTSQVLASRDAGATFTLLGSAGTFVDCCYVPGTHELFAVAPVQVVVTRLSDGTKTRSFNGLSSNFLSAAVDDADVLTIFAINDINGDMLGARVAAGATTVGTLKTVGHGAPGGAAALSRHATAVFSDDAEQLSFSVVTWP
jgi:hypothetical protein